MVVRGKGKTATLYIGGGIELFRILLFTSLLKGLNNYSSNYFMPEKHDCFLTTFSFCLLLYLLLNTQSYRTLSRNAQTKDFARLTSHSVRG